MRKMRRVYRYSAASLMVYPLLAFAVACTRPSPVWTITNVTLVPPTAVVCNTVQSYGLIEIGGKVLQPAPWTNDNTLVNNPYNNQWRCAIASVTATVNDANLLQVGDMVPMGVTTVHNGTYVKSRRALAYSVPITTPGQSTVVFERVIVASGDSTKSYDALKRSGALPIHLGKWPIGKADNLNIPLGKLGDVTPKDCTFYAGSDKVTCP